MQKRRKRKIVWIVLRVLQRYHDTGKIHDCTFEKVQPEIKKYFPNSKFNPFHLAWYKHHFLKGDLEFLYDAEASLNGVER